MYNMNFTKDYYKILDISKTSNEQEITKAYRKLSMTYHPDRPTGDKLRFQEISEAYEILGNIETKQTYDNMTLNSNKTKKSFNTHDEFEYIYKMISTALGGKISIDELRNMHLNNTHNIFENIPAHNLSSKHSNITTPITPIPPIIEYLLVPIDKIYTGTIMPIEIERWVENIDLVKNFEKETIYITIPQGTDNGEIILLSNQGNINFKGNKGDIKINIQIENNTVFSRSGLDILYNKTITVKEALCGFNFELNYINGKVYTINNKSGIIISNGYKKNIPNMGFTRNSHIGNLIISFTIKFPDKLSNDVIDKLNKINF